MKESNRTGLGSGSMKSLMRLLPHAKPFGWNFLSVVILVVIYNTTTILQPWLVKVAIDTDISRAVPNFHGLFVISLLYIGIVVIGMAANYLQILLLQYAGQSVIRKIRLDLFQHIERQSMAFFDTNAIGRLVTNVSSDTETVSQFFINFFLSMIRDGLSIMMIVIAMFELNKRIAGYSMIIIPIVFAISLLFRKRLRNAYQATRTRLSNIVAFLAENLAGMRIIQVFHQEERQAQEFDHLNEHHRSANIHEYYVSVWFNRTLELFGNIAVAAVIWVGGVAVLHHVILFGTLYAFISYIRQFFQPINSITQNWNTLQSSMVAAERIGRVLEIKPAIVDVMSPIKVKESQSIRGQISFRDVTFGYNPNLSVLKNITFDVFPGQFIGVVGPTGAGKSSIMSLLTRFYEPQQGEILLDGTDIRLLPQKNLHQWIGLVQQEVNLFTGTIIDNIRLFRNDVSFETVKLAAQTVGVHEMILRMPDGYNTLLHGKGASLSMGERQLISFARVVAQNPRVLILDEATANLDSKTEEIVQAGLMAITSNRTTLVIAHRLSTIRHADKIFVLNDGRIEESGSHDELLRMGGLYATLNEKSGIEEQISHR